jgi:hypothetical protein
LNDPGGSSLSPTFSRGGASTASGFSLTSSTHVHLAGTGGFQIFCGQFTSAVPVPAIGTMSMVRVATVHD